MCLIIPVVILYVFAISAFVKVPQSAGVYPNEFPLAIDLDRTVFFRGEKIVFSATITNNCGKEVKVATGGGLRLGSRATFLLYPFNLISQRIDFSSLHQTILSPGETITSTHEFWAIIPGVYVLDVYYSMYVYDDIVLTCDTGDCWISIFDNHVNFVGQLDPITIVVV